MELYPLQGSAIALRKDSGFALRYSRNIFTDNPGMVFDYTDADIIVFSREENYSKNELLFIPDSNRTILLIIAPTKKNRVNIPRMQEGIDLLAMALAMQKNHEDLSLKYDTFHTIFQKTTNLTAILNARGEVIEWNEAAEQLYGRGLADAPVSYIDFIHEDELQRTRELFEDLYRNIIDYRKTLDPRRLDRDISYRDAARETILQIGTRQGFTKLTSRSGDKTLNVDYTMSLIIAPGTLDIAGYIVTTTDITKRKSMHDRLEESERKYRELFNLVPLFSMLIDTSGKTIDYNYVSMEDYGLDPNHEGLSYMDFIHEEDRNRAASLFIDLFTSAVGVKNRWIKDKAVSMEECARELRSLRIRNEPLRLLSRGRDKFFETQFSASLWIGESGLEIKGALLSAVDVTERNNYRRKLEESEKKYRELIEKKTRDIIFSLDGRAHFVMVNSNIRDKLGYPEDSVIGRYIIDILYRDPIDKNQINRETFLENIHRVLHDRAPDVRFNAVCDHKFLGEPVTLQFKLDPIIENDAVVGIMGFASEISDDPLREYLQEETLSFTIDNRLTIADEVSFRITRNLQKFLPIGRINLLRLGLREMIINAIEHGNLGITYEEKTLAQKNQNYHDLLRERQMSAVNRRKKVRIDYHLTEDEISYTIRDEGDGFDYRKFIKLKVKSLNDQLLSHGRGILITRSVFDQIQYNDKGNEVHLVARLKKDFKIR
ncbi:MAG: PAS domain S-box protein [Spirochaetes bacterium]|nr:PAS domain S-box protein [Spirochaetota bacterium]